MNSITELLDLEDADILIIDTVIDGTRKILTVETHPSSHFCPSCGFRMHSRGIRIRTISHPILQDGFELVLKLKQRRWRCTNPECNRRTPSDGFAKQNGYDAERTDARYMRSKSRLGFA